MILCSSSMSTSFSTVGASQFPTVRLCFGPSCTTSLNWIYVPPAPLSHLVVVATLQRANHQSVTQRVLQRARASVLLRTVNGIVIIVNGIVIIVNGIVIIIIGIAITAINTLLHALSITSHSLSHIARHVQTNRLVGTVLRRRVIRLVEAAEQRREIQLARVNPSCDLCPSPTADCGTRTPSSRRARCSHRWPPTRDTCVSAPSLAHSSHSSSSFFTYATISYACVSHPSLAYVTRAVHAVQRQLVQVHRRHRAAVDRLRYTHRPHIPRRTATSPRRASGRSGTSAAASAAGGPRSRGAAGEGRGRSTSRRSFWQCSGCAKKPPARRVISMIW